MPAIFRKPDPQTVVTRTWLSGRPRPAGVLWASFSLFVMFVMTQAYWVDFQGAGSLAAVPQKVFGEGEWWRVFTALGVHADFKHLLSNSFMYFIFSLMLAGYFGGLLYPLLTIVLGAVVNWLALLTYAPEVILVGASGVVYLMAGEWLSLYFFIERRYSVPSRLIRCVGFTLAVLSPSAFEQNVSYRAHAIGLAMGLVAGAVFFFLNQKRYRAAEVVTALVDESDPSEERGLGYERFPGDRDEPRPGGSEPTWH